MAKSARCNFLILVLITFFATLQGCASGTGYTSGYRSMVGYEAGGHFYTVYYVTVVSDEAGIDRDRAKRLTCYAQSPDEISAYNAIPVSMKNMFYDRDYRHDVMNSLHSLHGGNTDAVNHRRETLQKLIIRSLKEGPDSDWKTGFMIHALGDSYAHVHGSVDSPKAFGEGVGHLFASIFGPDPDNVYAGENYKEFDAYIQALYAALADPSNPRYEANRKNVELVVEQIKSNNGKPNKEDKAFIRLLVSLTKDPIQESECSQLNSQLDDLRVRAFLSKLTAELFYVAPEA
ncbi:hypothetical protein D3C84_258660 [compost metagenome]